MYTIIERPDNNVQYIEIKNPKYKKDGKVKTEPVYICHWNGFDIVQIHTAFTLKEVYGDSIQHDSIFDCVNYATEGLTISKYLEKSSNDTDLVGVPYTCDNMTIERIK